MFGFLTSFVLLFAEGGHSSSGGFTKFYNEWLNIPGFEVWKFVNLAIFIFLLYLALVKLKVPESYKRRRDEIRAELIKAEQEKQAALTKLTAAEAKLAQLETEKANILQRATSEAAAEKQRMIDATNAEVERLRQQVEGDLARLSSQSRAQLRRFSAEESIRLAEQKLRSQIDGEKDARLVRASIQEIGGLN